MILYGLHYSSFSLRAKWALDHHGIAYEYREHLPMMTTPIIRARIGAWSGKVTVPILIDGATVVRDSLDIARYAESIGNGPPLFTDDEEVITAWHQTADQITESGRILTTLATAGNREALVENVPAFIPGPVRRLATPLVVAGTAYLSSKYGFSADDRERATRTMRAALERVANRLAESPSLGESFGWPDVAVVAGLQFVRPATDWVTLGPASVATFTQPELADEFADVLAWRDEIVAKRPRRRSPD